MTDDLEALLAEIAGGTDERIKAVAALSPTELVTQCNFADGAAFTVFDKLGAHDPCYVVLAGGSMIELNHWNDEITDVARAVFIARSCNTALTRTPPSDEMVERTTAKLIAKMAEAIDIADAIIEREMGTDTPKEWNQAFRQVQTAIQSRSE